MRTGRSSRHGRAPAGCRTFARIAAVLVAAQFGASHAQGLTFEDMAGRTIILSEPARSVVTIVNPTAANLISVDGSPRRLAGINPSSTGPLVGGILGQIFPEVAGIRDDIIAPSGGFVPNVETIAAIAPDVVVQWGDRGPDLLAPLENAGLTVAHYMLGLEEFSLRGNIMLGGMMGREARAETLNAWRVESWSAIATLADTIPPAARRTAIQLTPGATGFSVAAAGSSSDLYFSLVGLANPARDSAGTVSAEQIAAWDPDLIFIRSDSDDDIAAILDDPILSIGRAARHGSVYLLPIGTARWGTTTQDDPLFWQWLAELSYPDHYSFDLRPDLRDAFALMYAYDLSDEQIDAILRLGVNGHAAAYARFARRE